MELSASVYWLIPLAVLIVLLTHYIVKLSQRQLSPPIALSPEEYRCFRLIAKVNETPDTPNASAFRFRFALPTPKHQLGLPIGKHIVLRYKDADGRPVSRQYTPISSDTTTGWFELLIKLYPTGKMSQYLASLKIGDEVEVRGPMGMVEYQHGGVCVINRGGWKDQKVTHIGMIAGGTGLTPMYQLIQYITTHAQTDQTKLSFIFANVTEADILLRSTLDGLVEKHKEKLSIYYTINPPRPGESIPDTWKGGVGFVSKEMIEQHMPKPNQPESIIFICGPKPMTDAMSKHLTEMGYPATQFWVF